MSVPWYLMAKGKGGSSYKTASGPIVSVSDALAAPLRSLVANIDPVQDLHGYDNPWPAGGGKNKLEVTGTSTTQNGVTITVDSDGTISLSGTATDQVVFSLGSVALSGEYILSGCPSGGTYSTYFLYCVNYDYGSGATVTFDGTSKSVQLYVRSGVNTNGLVFKPMIRFASESDATFAPYSNICPISGWSAVNVWVKPSYDPTANPTATIQLGDTYYGGTLDVTSGVLTVDRVADTFTKDSAWYGFNTGPGNSSAVVQLSMYQNCKFVGGSASYNGSISSTGVEAPNYWTGARQNEVPAQGDMCFAYSSTGQLRFHRLDVTSITDLESFKSAFPDTTICYELATPIIIPLTATQISTLQGKNNLWADSGDVTVTYLASGDTDPNLMKLAVAFMGRR